MSIDFAKEKKIIMPEAIGEKSSKKGGRSNKVSKGPV